jgi:TrmH family RNA methyltransferase
MKISKAKVSFIASLKLKKNRDAESLFMAEGEKCVADTFPCFKLKYLVVRADYVYSDAIRSIVDSLPDDVLLEASHQDFNKISSLATPPSVVAVFHKPEWSVDRSLIVNDITLMLDGVQDPGNLGTIIRLADWFGVRQIFCSRTTVDLFNSKTIQSTMGALARERVFYVDLASLIDEYDIPVCGLLLEGENIYHKPLPSPAFVLMGSEGRGVSQELRRKITSALLIPSYPPGEPTSESLNVATATAITLAEFRRGLC